MKTECDDAARIYPLEYKQLAWGDLIYGTKEELQAIGLGIDMAFPGEPGGPKRRLNVRDPRGFATKIERWYDGSKYCASIPFPGREQLDPPWIEVAPGVKKSEGTWSDVFIGTPESLAAAGLVRVDQLPGQPGMRKVRVTILPDGSVLNGPCNSSRHDGMGTRVIERASKKTYSVSVSVARAEGNKRLDALKIAELDYEQRMRALPRPAPLTRWHRLAELARKDTRFQSFMARVKEVPTD